MNRDISRTSVAPFPFITFNKQNGRAICAKPYLNVTKVGVSIERIMFTGLAIVERDRLCIRRMGWRASGNSSIGVWRTSTKPTTLQFPTHRLSVFSGS